MAPGVRGGRAGSLIGDACGTGKSPFDRVRMTGLDTRCPVIRGDVGDSGGVGERRLAEKEGDRFGETGDPGEIGDGARTPRGETIGDGARFPDGVDGAVSHRYVRTSEASGRSVGFEFRRTLIVWACSVLTVSGTRTGTSVISLIVPTVS